MFFVSFDEKMEEDASLFLTDLEEDKIGAHHHSAAAGHHMTFRS